MVLSMSGLFKIVPKHFTLTSFFRAIQMWTCWSVSNHCWITPAAYELMTGHSPSRFSAEFIHGSVTYDNSSRSWSSKAALDHHTTTAMVDCCYHSLFMKCCVSVTQIYQDTNLPKSLLPHQSTQSWVSIFAKCETNYCVLFGRQRFLPLYSPIHPIFVQSLSLFILLFLLLNCEHWP